MVFAVEQEGGERLAQLGLADAGRARGTGTSRSAGSGPTGPSASAGSRWRPRRSPRPGRRRARAASLPSAAACRARPASAWRPGCRSRARRPRRSPRRRPRAHQLGLPPSAPFFALFACASFSFFSSSGSVPYCSSATLLKSPLRFSSSIWKRVRSISSSSCAEPCAAAFSGLPDLLEVGDLALHALDLLLDQVAPALCDASSFSFFDRRALDLQLDQPAVELVHRLGLRVDLDLDLRRRLVDQVDRLVGQEAVGDVAVRELGRGDDRRVGDLDAVVRPRTSPAGRAGSRSSPRRSARRRGSSGSGARARRPSRCTCGTRRASSRRCSAARRARARA